MARQSAKGIPAARTSSKRAAAEKATPTRQSKRTKATAKTSYVEPASDHDNDEDFAGLDSGSSEKATKVSDFEDEESEDPISEPDHEEPSTEEEAKPKKMTPKAPRKKRPHIVTPSEEYQMANNIPIPSAAAANKIEVGTQLVIKKPKAREEGDTPYSNDRIHPNTMLFLKDLAANNDRQWLKMHDPDYRKSLDDFTTFLEVLSEKISEIDETIPELPVKDIIFRIYRDVRFSKDQTPYKVCNTSLKNNKEQTHFSAAWSRTGRKGPYAAYYVQLMPDGGSFVGGGLWSPEAQALGLLRDDIDRKPHKIKRVLTDAGIRKSFLGGVGDDQKKAVKAFTSLRTNESTALKSKPKGYDKDHVDIELLRLKNFTLGTKVSDDEMVGPKGLDRIAELVARMVPFVTYLNSVVMPDGPDGESDDAAPDSEDDNDASNNA